MTRNKQLPDIIQKLFTNRKGGYDYRRSLNFQTRSVWTTMKRLCTSVSGVYVWNKLSQELKQCPIKSLFNLNLIFKFCVHLVKINLFKTNLFKIFFYFFIQGFKGLYMLKMCLCMCVYADLIIRSGTWLKKWI